MTNAYLINRRQFAALIIAVLLSISPNIRPNGALNAAPPAHPLIDHCSQLMTNPAADLDDVRAPSIRFIEPDDDVIDSNFLTVVVGTANAPPANGEIYWQLWINRELHSRNSEEFADVTLNFGTYEICIMLEDGSGQDYGVPAGAVIAIVGTNGGGIPVATLPPDIHAEVQVVDNEPTVVVTREDDEPALNIPVVIAAFLIAGAGGWIVGRWLPKRLRASSTPSDPPSDQ
ncbi:MAG: hypothetical protein GYB67_03610 [Chloroflexi bacterium]|nr:hypothetical protein [Chloroflexota bacterium]